MCDLPRTGRTLRNPTKQSLYSLLCPLKVPCVAAVPSSALCQPKSPPQDRERPVLVVGPTHPSSTSCCKGAFRTRCLRQCHVPRQHLTCCTCCTMNPPPRPSLPISCPMQPRQWHCPVPWCCSVGAEAEQNCTGLPSQPLCRLSPAEASDSRLTAVSRPHLLRLGLRPSSLCAEARHCPGTGALLDCPCMRMGEGALVVQSVSCVRDPVSTRWQSGAVPCCQTGKKKRAPALCSQRSC